jgi:putative ABC transport system permease protein
MSRLHGLRVALRSLVRRKRVEAELDEEVQYHLERQIQEGLKTGLTPEQARSAALRAMGPIDKSKEECRDLRSGNLTAEFLTNLRYAGRALRRSPGFAVLAIAIMALGIGANTAVFSVVNGVLLKPLPYQGADRIVTLRTAFLIAGGTQTLVSIANYRDWRDQSASFEAMATYRGGESPVSPGTAAEYGRLATVDAQFFRVFAVEPLMGRTFTPEETVPDNAQRTAVISYAYWQSRFGGAADILQRTIRVGARVHPIVGVMPAGFHFPGETNIWVPQTTSQTSRTGHNFFAVARLKPHVSLEQAQAELTTIAARLEQQYPDSNKGRGVTAVRLQEELVGDVRLTLYLLWGVVGVVLLIACANTATLLLGKATTRTREMAVRTALGAGRGRIVRQLITESLLLALVAGAVGTLLAFWGARALVALSPAAVVRGTDSGIDGSVLAFTFVVSLATSLLFGLVPALHASKVDLVDAVKQGGARSVVGGRMVRTRGILVVSEIALAVVLLIGAGLLIKSLVALHNTDLGFQPENVLVIKATGVRSREDNNVFFGRLMSRMTTLPGVAAVGATSNPPGDFSNAGTGAHFVDRFPEQRDRTRETLTLMTIVAPGSFAALGIPLKSGRDFNEGDTGDRPLVAVVNEALVRKSFGSENPIGRTIFCSFDRKEGMTIVGVAGDVRQRNPAIVPMPECYMPYRQHSYNNATLNVVARTAGDPMDLAETVRRAAAEISPEVPLAFSTMDARVSKSVEDPRFRALLFGIFAALAVCLAMAGVYGVMAFGVQQRSREIGLRMALGASQASVLRLILEQGLLFAAAGLAVGFGTAVAAARFLETVLFEVQPVDTQVYVAVALLLGLVTLLASYLPARRAAGLDPAAVLQAE